MSFAVWHKVRIRLKATERLNHADLLDTFEPLGMAFSNATDYTHRKVIIGNNPSTMSVLDQVRERSWSRCAGKVTLG